jgi:acyl-CoA thioester hydrolase
VDGYEVELALQVRFRDLDALNHVNNAVFASYLELARVEYYRQLWGKAAVDHFDFILGRMEIDYLAPIGLADSPVCGIAFSEVGRSSFIFEYSICDGLSGIEFARARSVQVCYDYEKRQVKAMDGDLVAKVTDLRARNGLAPPGPKAARNG